MNIQKIVTGILYFLGALGIIIYVIPGMIKLVVTAILIVVVLVYSPAVRTAIWNFFKWMFWEKK